MTTITETTKTTKINTNDILLKIDQKDCIYCIYNQNLYQSTPIDSILENAVLNYNKDKYYWNSFKLVEYTSSTNITKEYITVYGDNNKIRWDFKIVQSLTNYDISTF